MGCAPQELQVLLYWEHPELLVDPEKQDKADMLARKLAWLRRARAEFGECGRILYVDGKAVGYAQYAPGCFLPNVASYPSGPVSSDAVFLSCLFIPAKEHRRRGILFQSILEGLRARGAEAVETFARRDSAENPSGPAEFYLAHGFRVHRDDPQFPLLRLEVERACTLAASEPTSPNG